MSRGLISYRRLKRDDLKLAFRASAALHTHQSTDDRTGKICDVLKQFNLKTLIREEISLKPQFNLK